MKKRILVALDLGFDPGWELRARLSLDHALRLAGRLKLGIDLVHVAEFRGASATQPGALKLMQRFAEEQKERLKQLCTECRGVSVSPLFMKGDPVEKLIQLSSKRAQYECLVIATHGRTGLTRVLLGSVAEEVIRHSKIPVFCIGAAAQKGFTSGVRGEPSIRSRFLVATDLGVNSRRAEKLSFEWAKKLGADGILFHSLREGLHPVIQTAYGAGRGSVELESLLEPHRERARKALDLRRKAWTRKGLQCEVVLEESHANAEQALLAVAEQKGASLIFMGTHGRNAASRAFLGSTAREVVLGASVPTVTLRS